MNESSAYVGLDVHKDTIAVAVALPGREEPVYRGEIKNKVVRDSSLSLSFENAVSGDPGPPMNRASDRRDAVLLILY